MAADARLEGQEAAQGHELAQELHCCGRDCAMVSEATAMSSAVLRCPPRLRHHVSWLSCAVYEVASLAWCVCVRATGGNQLKNETDKSGYQGAVSACYLYDEMCQPVEPIAQRHGRVEY
jgi:hypothetical protein